MDYKTVQESRSKNIATAGKYKENVEKKGYKIRQVTAEHIAVAKRLSDDLSKWHYHSRESFIEVFANQNLS